MSTNLSSYNGRSLLASRGSRSQAEEQWGDLSRRALESLVAQAYREESLTLGKVRRILGHETRIETEAFLKEQGALLDYSEEELDQDLEAALKASNQ